MSTEWIDDEGRLRLSHDDNYQLIMPVIDPTDVVLMMDAWDIELACRMIVLGFNENIKYSIEYGLKQCPHGSRGNDRASALITIMDRILTLANAAIKIGLLKENDTPANWIKWAQTKGYKTEHLTPTVQIQELQKGIEKLKNEDYGVLCIESYSEQLNEWKSPFLTVNDNALQVIKQNEQVAERILDNFGQHNRFLRLTELYKKGAINPFIGAGMSAPSQYPLWTEFLRQQRKQTLISESDLENMICNGRYEDAAQQIADAMGIAFNEAVDATYGCSREIIGAVKMLPYLFSDNSVVTTNFDNVLERSYEDANKPFEEKISGHDSNAIRKKLAQNRRLLLMLHGTATSGNGRILTTREYEQHYCNGNALQKTIESICGRNSLLFIGCSLTVDRVLSAIKAFVQQEGHDNLPKHYAFLEEPDSEEERITRQNLLANEFHIYPIWYPQGMHDESIEAFFIKLWNSQK